MDAVRQLRRNDRKLTYTRQQADKSIICRKEVITKDQFIDLIRDATIQIKSKTVLRLRQKTSVSLFLPKVVFSGLNVGHSSLKNNSRTPNLNLIPSNRKLSTGLSISLKKAI